jgi:hypothetical protein
VESDPVFARFVERRSRLLESLDGGRTRVDEWLEEHKTKRPNITALAYLEGLIAERRSMLEELMVLDESLLEHLVVLLGQGSAPAS